MHHDTNIRRLGAYASLAVLFGTVISGPVALAVVHTTHPQPAWTGPDAFVRSYHWIQTLPFFAGLVLVSGFIALIASIRAAAREEETITGTIAIVFVAAFASLVFLNYVLQTTFVPGLARTYVDADAPIVAAFSMANPRSLAWCLEMWGYGFLGVATWLVAPMFRGGNVERAAALAFRANGPISVLGALWTAAQPGWVQTRPGLVSFAAWNLLVIVMAALSFAAFRYGPVVRLVRTAGADPSPTSRTPRSRSVPSPISSG